MNPIIYTASIGVRYGDLDPYGHVNSAVYLDYIISSRWIFLEKRFGLSAHDIISKGVAFFLVNANIDFLRELRGTQMVDVSSYVSRLESSELDVSFTIYRQDKKIASSGTLRFTIMDLRNMTRQSLPQSLIELFFEQEKD